MRRLIKLLLLMILYAAPASAYYDFMPYDALLSFEDARAYKPEGIRADLHINFGTSSGFWDREGYSTRTENNVRAIFIPVRLGWTFDEVWDASFIFDAYNYRGRSGDFSNGIGDIWLTGRGMWQMNNADSVRLGPRVAFRFPIKPESVTSAGALAVDLSAVMHYKETGKRFSLDTQLGFRQDFKGERYDRDPGPSFYLVAEPGVVVGRSESFIVSAPIGTYFGLGLLSSHYLWTGLRTRYFVDENVAITLGANFPINGYGAQLNRYVVEPEQYNCFYVGVESFIPTRR
ncbi:MAG: hypothetical protein GY771_01655 [bacterium]|nr:hypothetical protein [bacterium]